LRQLNCYTPSFLLLAWADLCELSRMGQSFYKKKFLCLSHGLKKQADTFFVGTFTTCACSQVALYDLKITEKGIKAFFVKHEVIKNQYL
jgi:hypothetical protein